MSMSAETAGARMGGGVEGDAATTVHWLMSELVERAAGARHALLLSADGLLLSASAGVEREEAERLAASASGFASLARGARSQLGAREVRQTVVEMDSVVFFVLSAGRGASLALVAESSCDMGQAAFEINRVVRQVGPHLAALPRRKTGCGGVRVCGWAAGRGASLPLGAGCPCDMGQAAFAITRLVRQVGPQLAALPRRKTG